MLLQKLRLFVIATVVVICHPAVLPSQTQRQQTGYDQLSAEKGGSLETGSAVSVAIVEAPAGSAYLPNTAEAEFSGKTITDASNSNVGSSSHATLVSRSQFGNSTSLSPGVTNITGFEANDWINRVLGFSNNNMKTAPMDHSGFASMNHSYIFNGQTAAVATELNARIDLVADRDNVVIAVGANNGANNPLPQGWAHSHNAITVGLTSGNHSHGTTTFNRAGRVKPDIVAPAPGPGGLDRTSYSTPLVASAAAMLRHQAMNSNNPNAQQNEVIKAAILGGATKDEFNNWSNTPTQPLDSTFGAGELNIYNSYKIMEAGEFNGSSTEPVMNVNSMGWDYDASISAGQNSYYNVDLSNSQESASILLTWNAQVSDSGGILDYDTINVANLDLKLYNSTNSFMGALVAQSISTVDNVEHIFLENFGAGKYTIAVEGITGMTDFGLAWKFTAVPEPSCFLPLALILGLARRRKTT